MPDTGSPWNIPYVAGTDLVRDWPTDSQELAEAVADGLDAAGGLVAVKHALFTGTQTNSTAGGANFAITDLSITHTLADASNKLIISAFIGQAANDDGRAQVGLVVADDGTLINVGTSVGNRNASSAGGFVEQSTGSTVTATMPALTFVYAPGDTASHTYTVRAKNLISSTQTIYINRNESDTDNADRSRSVSGFVIQEVKV